MVSKQKRIFLNLIDEFLNLLRDGLLLIDSYEISRKLFEVRIRKKSSNNWSEEKIQSLNPMVGP